MVEYRYAPIGKLASALRERRISAAELAEQATSVLAEIGPHYNAVAQVMPERAADEARDADRRLAAGGAPLLCGIPYGAKDLFAARGAPTTWGSAEFADQEFTTDATAVRRLSRRGAVLAAKLAMSEFAGGGKPVKAGASMHGQGRNPWNVERYSGGSSSGSGIAVAAGLVPFALGTETGGSTIGPAAFSGITGIRPTFGLLPRAGAMTLSWTLDKVGVLARSADDVAIVMDALAGSSSSFHEASTSEPDRAIRVAISSRELEEASPSIRAALERGIADFRDLFGNVVDVELDRTPPYIPALELIVSVEGGFGLRDHLRRPDFAMSDERQLRTLRSGLEAPVAGYLEATRVTIPQTRKAFDTVFADADVILSASRTDIAPRIDQERPPRDASKISDLLRAGGNLAGVPGISFPCGLSDEGMPVGLQLLGPRGSDAVLLSVAAAYQRATDHHLQRPPESS
ncbi:MAG TPA: amidase [Candidatus Limnocylindrales bacterium]|nr:amidase [Candidatus Limnocylindrales bacterium]